MEKIFLMLSVVGLVNCLSVPFQDCGSEYKLTEIHVENCKYLPCPIFMEEFTAFTVTLNASFPSKNLNQEIIIKTKQINTRVSSTPGACEGIRACPVDKGDASFTAQLWAPDIAPFPSTLQWIITNENDKQVMCFILNILLCDHNYPNEKCHQ